MIEWKTIANGPKYGVVMYNYNMKGPFLLSLVIGDTVVIKEENGDWYMGYSTKNRNEKGAFPKSFVAVKEATIVQSGSMESITPKELPIVQEITSVVREWYHYWKSQYVSHHPDFAVIQEMIDGLLKWRKEIKSRKITTEQMKDLKQKVAAKIDIGNLKLGLDLVVRDDEGNILIPSSASVVRIYKEHVEVADRLKHEMQGESSAQVETKASVGATYNLFVMLHNFVCRADDVEVLVNLYDAVNMKYICENYIIKWDKEKLAGDQEFLSSIKVVFTDLDAKDRHLEKVFLVFQIVRNGVMDHKDSDDKKQTKGLRRPFGAASMDITKLLQAPGHGPVISEVDEEFVPFLQCGEKEFMESCVKKTVTGREFTHRGQGLFVSLKLLKGVIKQIREDFPHIVQPNTNVVRKMGFPDVIMPGDVRNDIYVTIIEGNFSRGSKTADKNVEVTMLMCNKGGDPLEGVINTGCGTPGASDYKTLIYYHEDTPKWCETCKVTVSTEAEFRGLHLKFLFKHKSRNESKDKNERPFAMAFVKLLNKNGTTLMDGEHELLLYKIDYKKGEDKGHNPYIDLPSTQKELEASNNFGTGNFTQGAGGTHKKIPLFSGQYSLSYRDTFKISTFVCSTKLTHNVDLLGCLSWQKLLEQNDTASLKLHLKGLMKVDGEEIVKFLQDLLDSLFYILMQPTVSDLYDSLVFDALVYIIGLVADSRYFQFRPILDAYILSFSQTTAYIKLMSILKEYVDNANEDTEHDASFRQAMKSLEYIFKFIIRSRELFAMLNENTGKQQFEIMLRQLIQSIGGMMLYTSDRPVRAQGYALRNMPATIPDILKVFNGVELSHLFVEFLSHVPKSRLKIQKIKCVEDLVQTPLFSMAECREVLLPMMLGHIRDMMEAQDEMSACIKVLSHIMDTLFTPSKPLFHDRDIDKIMDIILRTVIQTTIKTHAEAGLQMDEGHGETFQGDCVAVLLNILRQMSETHYNNYIATKFFILSDLEDFLMEIIMLFQNLIQESVYQNDWMEMIMLQNSIILRALRCFAHTIVNKFSTPFKESSVLWNNFFHCAISFLTQPHLQLENFSTSKRQKIVSQYNDMRREMGFEIRSMWYSLGANKIKFIPEMVGPLLEMSLIPETELRKAAIPMFFDMMVCEFNQPNQNGKGGIEGNFKKVETEMVNQLDALVEGGRGDEQYMHLFKDILTLECNSSEKLRKPGHEFVEMVTKLLQRLLEYRHIIQDDIKDHRMSCIVNLLDFYDKIDRREMYVRYLHKLCTMHLECDNYTEAACTFQLYAKLLSWSEDPLPAILVSEKFPEAQTHRELKEMLYHHVVSYFDKGQMWEMGIELCKEIANLYENVLFDYEKLSFILRQQAGLFEKVMKEMRPDPEYFRVGYYGNGFPSFLQNKVFIYRGKAYERLQDFCGRMQTLFPNAELMKTLNAPSEELKESEKQYLQINAVTPVMELHQKFRNKEISEKILKYYQINEVKMFTYSRRIDEGGSNIANIWQEKFNMLTSNPLPGILCWFPVTDTVVCKVSPIETAIETLNSSNKKLTSAIDHLQSEHNAQANQLGMLLKGIVDAAVNGGISNWKHFYADDFATNKKDEEFVVELKEATKNQASLIRDGMFVHKRRCAEVQRQFHMYLEEKFAEWINMIEKEYNIKIKGRSSSTSTLKKNNSLSALSLDKMSSMYPSNTNHSMKRWHKDQSSGGSLTNVSQAMGGASPTSSKILVSGSRMTKVFTNSEQKVLPRRGAQSKVNRKGKGTSQISSASSSDSLESNRNSLDQPITLTEQITPRRPPRPEADKDRRNSQRLSAQYGPMPIPGGYMSPLSSGAGAKSHTSLAQASFISYTQENGDAADEEAPPPLPDKQSHEHSSLNSEPPPIPSRTSAPSRTPRKSKVGFFDGLRWMHRQSISQQGSSGLKSPDGKLDSSPDQSKHS
ncbi:dedicator of cytokinesis protein 1-like isoform X3 [Dreissena polymorpha]|uniref:dedicator of cytokinesis protein 1-like isoform X3 n=1 Tax=Dreissena polymorpha TaxID=45954 RepID=UPI002264421D|nr:dedicator of cytokinesis protein 1-like isoform X3 [Dreissena polymorpha]